MARKDAYDFFGALAFLVLLVAGVCRALVYFDLIESNMIALVNQICYVALVIIVIGCGWNYARKLHALWQVIYVVLAILAVVGVISI